MENRPEYTLRDGRMSDLAFLNAFNYSEGMDELSDAQGVIVAADSDDDPIGYIRIKLGETNKAYVNPIVINPAWRNHGVGRALVDAAIGRYGALWLVSRGPSIGFYERLGFQACPWDDIEDGMSEDCPNCTMRAECAPLPMCKTPQAG